MQRIRETMKLTPIINEVLKQKFDYLSTYSPELAPVELGFSNVRRYLQEHEVEAIINPIEWINKAFHINSIWGERSDSGKYYLLS